MKPREFGDAEAPTAVRLSHGDFGFVVQPFDDTAGEFLAGAKVVQQELAVSADSAREASFVTGLDPGFRLIETMKCDGDSFSNLDCIWVDWPLPRRISGFRAIARLSEPSLIGCERRAPDRCRGRHGCCCPETASMLERLVLGKELEHLRLMLATLRTDSRDILLRHKTTARALYDEEFARAQHAGFCDVLFCNQRGEVTEASRGSVFFKLDGT